MSSMEKGGYALSKSRSAGYIRRASAAIDIEPFAVDNFSASDCKQSFEKNIIHETKMFLDLKVNMPNDSDDTIHTVHRTLQMAHEMTVSELGKSFYRNYQEFVSVSQEAERFDGDLSIMRAMMAQLKGFNAEITGSRLPHGN